MITFDGSVYALFLKKKKKNREFSSAFSRTGWSNNNQQPGFDADWLVVGLLRFVAKTPTSREFSLSDERAILVFDAIEIASTRLA